MVTKLDCIPLASILNMYVRHEVIKVIVDCVLGMISSSGSEPYTILHTLNLHYTHQILVQRPQAIGDP